MHPFNVISTIVEDLGYNVVAMAGAQKEHVAFIIDKTDPSEFEGFGRFVRPNSNRIFGTCSKLTITLGITTGKSKDFDLLKPDSIEAITKFITDW